MDLMSLKGMATDVDLGTHTNLFCIGSITCIGACSYRCSAEACRFFTGLFIWILQALPV